MLNRKLPYNPEISLPDNALKTGFKKICVHQYSQQPVGGTTQEFERGMDKHKVVWIYNGILFNLKKEKVLT